MGIVEDFPVLCVLPALAIVITANVSADCGLKSGTGFFLIGHVYKRFLEEDFQQCYEKCKADEPTCRSLNYHGDQKRCELNNTTRTFHPDDIMENPFSSYFESRYRVSLGSQRSVAGRTCKEIFAEEGSATDGLYWLNSNETEEPYVTFCSMTNGGDSSSSFDLIFHERNTTNFVELDISSPDFSAFTVCFWFRAWERQLVFLSYATESFTDAIMMFLSSTGLLRFLVLDEQIHGQTGNYNDRSWHHLCGKWADHEGVVKLFVDGKCKLAGGRSIHGVIPGSGKFILGQDQDTIGEAFDREQSFVGEMSHLYLWNIDLDDSVITSLSMRCKEYPHPGYIVGWSDFAQGLHGNVTRRNNSRCITKQDMLPDAM